MSLLDMNLIARTKGFLDEEEGLKLYDLAREISRRGPCLEIGSYCGKSALYLGSACRENNGILFSIDHHRGSEEHQPGEFFHDPDLYNPGDDVMDSFGEFRRNIRRAGLEETVVPVVADSATAARHWQTPLAMIFIDGGHSLDAALTDYRCWVPHLIRGGILAIHDLFASAEAGGQAPHAIYRLALASGMFESLGQVNSLGLLRRL